MPEVNAARKLIVCFFAFGVLVALAGHKHQARQSAAQITWHDVNVELQNVESARVDLFNALNNKMASQR